MDDKKQFSRRLLAIGVLFSLVLAAYFVTLFDAQIVHGAEYRARSIRANTKSETVVTSRGILTDRNGKALVTNRSVYTLELDTSLAPSDDAALNKELLRLIELLENRGIVWEDTLPPLPDVPAALTLQMTLQDVEAIDTDPAALARRLCQTTRQKHWLAHPKADLYLAEKIALFQRLYR